MTGHSILLLGILRASLTTAFWRAQVDTAKGPRHDLHLSPYEALKSGSRPSEVYHMALNELQNLESEPLCHRVAARLLVGNCQLLDGKDEATTLTDSGREVRDFVDSYAASLAICDLERGRFNIPSECEKFREPVLGQLPISDPARLHVTSREIDRCLSGLATESSAWSTWVSYRHKALRFCEAARVDQEKTQSILLYQRLIKVMARLTHGVETELQKHMEDLEIRMRRASDIIQKLEPELDQLRRNLASAEDYVSHDIASTFRALGDLIHSGFHDATKLQQLLSVMIRAALDGTLQTAAAQEKSLQTVNQYDDLLNVWALAVSTATTSAESLNTQIEISRMNLEGMHMRQKALEEGFVRLEVAVEGLSSKQDDHERSLREARNITVEILESLGEATSSAYIIAKSKYHYIEGLNFAGWIPYLVSPVATLVLGSYGLAPSAARNLGLIALGEIMGFTVSHFDRLAASLPRSARRDTMTNATGPESHVA